MVDLATILAGFADAFTLTNIFFVICGVALGQFVGAVPGIGPVMAMAIAIPFTFSLTPLAGIAFLVGVSKGGLVGGALPAILINTPGTPDAAATALDGYPLAKQGKPLKATKMALFSSVTGDTFSDIVLITVSAPLAVLALRMGPVEVLALMIMTFAVLSALMGDSVAKGLIAAGFGFFCATVGSDPEHFTPRMIFGMFDIYDGLPLVSVAIGALAISEIMRRLSEIRGEMRPAVEIQDTGNPDDTRVTWVEYWGSRFVILRGAVIGTILGALPGIGSTAAAFMSYAATKSTSKDPESFGKGNIHGIAAAESANSAVAGANLIPLLTLGIPGSVAASLIISAFMIHGIQPGPLLFQDQGQLIYGLFGAMLMANFTNLWLGQLGLRLWVKVISAPESIIFASAILLSIVGVALSTSGLFGVGVMLVFALIGYLMTSFGYSIVIFIIAFFLGPRFEISLSQSLSLMSGDLTQIYRYPIAVALLAGAVVFLVWFFATKTKRGGEEAGYTSIED
ncbi:tripartite tricarboxylate transporter permease [Marinovum sp. 2_MG-2023]|uniref:tripartite tricarboxylate transporter permease n=1 Tax=unclassified Marinovum TaxID=2647166 RepID=UPI0026E3328E|nr:MULTISPECIES: tripartite tricarboxylate transporter permease [unclassified Marinovum]MDO6729056.1 tripartite tricarboxylate transporter permease [Marinovum sp. 2_MG-2023]MDO6779317.1 tripartite tricarboxylate transporter permease [Marinovum sp. 1_MG-2023]